METEWVLRRRYRWSRGRINDAFVQFLSLGQIETSVRHDLFWALDRHLAGADWADMLHLLAARGRTSFATFDRKLAKAVGADTPISVTLLA